jgi:hypothetical protein
MRPTVPASVPVPGATTTGVTADVSVAPVTDSTALDTQPDARQNPPAQANPTTPPAENTPAAEAAPLPTNRQPVSKKEDKKQQKKDNKNRK